jgi:hypothetical protein
LLIIKTIPKIKATSYWFIYKESDLPLIQSKKVLPYNNSNHLNPIITTSSLNTSKIIAIIDRSLFFEAVYSGESAQYTAWADFVNGVDAGITDKIHRFAPAHRTGEYIYGIIQLRMSGIENVVVQSDGTVSPSGVKMSFWFKIL